MSGRSVLIATMVTSFLTTFMSSSLNLSVPAMESFFHVNAATISWVISAYTMTVAALSLPLGKVADATGRRRVFLTGIAGFGLMSIASVFAVNIAMLIAFRVLQAMCAAMMFATNNAILISAYPHSMQGKVLGYSVASTYTGLTLGPVLGGFLNTHLGWKAIFTAAAIVALAAFSISFRSIPRDAHGRASVKDPAGRPDVRGTVLYVAAIALSLYGLANMTVSPGAKLVFAAGVALIAVFFAVEAGTENPIMKVSMFKRSRTFTFSNLAALLNYGSTFAISYTVSLYLQLVRGYPSDRAGLILIVMPAMQAVFSPWMGSLSDRVDPSKLASGGMGMCAAALILLTRLRADTPIALVMLPLLIAGFGFAMFSSPNNNAIMSCVEREDYSVANSIIATMRNYGQSCGMAVLNIVTGIVLGQGALETAAPEQIVTWMRTAFIVFVFISIAGIFFSLARNKQ